MKKPGLLIRALLTFIAGFLAAGGLPAAVAAEEDAPDMISAGRRIRIESKILKETREVWVRQPADSGENREDCLLIIQLGGGTHFLYSAGVVDFLSRYDHLPRMIVAAVLDPTPLHHYRDSTPTRVDYLPASGGAPLFLRFLKEELIPTLEARFRSRPFRILCGHGLSGLFAVYALLESPGTFGACLTDGASLTYDDSVILKKAELRLADPGLRGALYLGVGNELETIPGIHNLAGLLARKAPAGLDWEMEILSDEDQGTASLPVFYRGLKWIFRDWRIPVEVAVRGMDAVKGYYRALSAKFGYDIPVGENTLAVRGFQLIREQRFEEAATLFDLNAAAFPESPNVYHNLAMLSERRKQWDKAAAFYEKAAQKAGPERPELVKFFRRQAEQAKNRVRMPA